MSEQYLKEVKHLVDNFIPNCEFYELRKNEKIIKFITDRCILTLYNDIEYIKYHTGKELWVVTRERFNELQEEIDKRYNR